MSTPQSPAGSKRGLRDRPLGRVLILVAVLVVAGLAARSCAQSGRNVSPDEAIEAARQVALFEPDDVQVRFFRRGVPSEPFWGVSMYQGTATRPTLVQVVIVDAKTGDVVDDGRDG